MIKVTEKRVLYVLVGLLLLATFLDIYTALTSPIFEIAEMNPIYVLTGSKAPLLVLTFVMLWWYISVLKNSISIQKLYVITLATILLIFGHGIGVYGNTVSTNQYLESEDNPVERAELVEEYRNYDMGDKINNYLIIVGVFLLIPFVISITAFYVAMYFYDQRKPQRDKIMNDICKLTDKLKK